MKKLFSVMLASTMLLGLVACAPKEDSKPATKETKVEEKADKKAAESKAAPAKATGQKYSLKLWGSQDDQEFLKDRIKAFQEANKDNEYDIQLGVVGEPDAQTKVLEDLDAAADVFAFPNDQLRELVKAGALYKVSRPDDIKQIKEGKGVDAFTEGENIYAFPFSADNGYFLYYDNRVFSADDVKDLDTMLEKAKKANKKVGMDISNGWYIASFFLANGGKFEIDQDGVQKVNFNDENAVAAGEAIKAFTANEAFKTGDDNEFKAALKDGSLAAFVSGTWNAADVKEILGEGYAATKLPEVTIAGQKKQLGSFAGYKGYGVNAHTKSPEAAMDLARFLTNEESQAKRFEMRATGPANNKVAESEAVKKDVALSALLAQQPYAVSQNNVLGSYWGPAEAFGTAMEQKDYSKSVKELLDEMVKQIQVKPESK